MSAAETDKSVEPRSEFANLMTQGQRQANELAFTEAAGTFEEALKVAGRILGPERAGLENEARLAYSEACVITGRWDRAQRELQRLLEACRDGEVAVRVRALLLVGEVMSSRGEPDVARESFRSAISLAESHNDAALLNQARCHLAAVAGQTGELDLARDLLDAILEALGNNPGTPEGWELKGAALAQMGLYYFRQARNGPAEDCFDRALEAVQKVGRLSLEEANIRRYLGVMAGLRGGHRQALDFHLEALNCYTRAGCRFGQAKVYDSIGRTFMAVNRMEEAVFSFKKSESICRRLGANAELATLYGKLGQVYMLREDYETAVKFFRRDLDISTRFRNYYALGYSYRNLGRCLIQLGAFEEAITNLTESIGLFQFVEDWINLGRVHMDLSLAYIKAGKASEAQDACRRARTIFEEHGMHKELSFLLCLSGCIARLNEEYGAAETMIRQCVEQLSGRRGAWLAEAHYELGMLFRVQGRLEEAVAAFQEALRIARQSGLIRHTGRYLVELESLNEEQLFRTWMEDLPEGPATPKEPPASVQVRLSKAGEAG